MTYHPEHTARDVRGARPEPQPHPGPVHEKHEHPVDDETLHDEIARESPEGAPAEHPMHPAGIRTLALSVVGVVIVAAVAVALASAGHPWVAVAALGFAVAALGANPVLWAALLRAKEREQLIHRIEGGNSHSARP
jgi:hypothetical protein